MRIFRPVYMGHGVFVVEDPFRNPWGLQLSLSSANATRGNFHVLVQSSVRRDAEDGAEVVVTAEQAMASCPIEPHIYFHFITECWQSDYFPRDVWLVSRNETLILKKKHYTGRFVNIYVEFLKVEILTREIIRFVFRSYFFLFFISVEL